LEFPVRTMDLKSVTISDPTRTVSDLKFSSVIADSIIFGFKLRLIESKQVNSLTKNEVENIYQQILESNTSCDKRNKCQKCDYKWYSCKTLCGNNVTSSKCRHRIRAKCRTRFNLHLYKLCLICQMTNKETSGIGQDIFTNIVHQYKILQEFDIRKRQQILINKEMMESIISCGHGKHIFTKDWSNTLPTEAASRLYCFTCVNDIEDCVSKNIRFCINFDANPIRYTVTYNSITVERTLCEIINILAELSCRYVPTLECL
jgi:hypothetical protein